MVPVDHPEYRGFDLSKTEALKTPKLRRVADNLDRSDLDTSYETYQVVFYAREDVSSPSSQAELILVPSANRARLAHGPNCQSFDAGSAEEAVRTWLGRASPA